MHLTNLVAYCSFKISNAQIYLSNLDTFDFLICLSAKWFMQLKIYEVSLINLWNFLRVLVALASLLAIWRFGALTSNAYRWKLT